MDKLRNVALIAHVDHGKTTLVDGILRQTGVFRAGQAVSERVLDSGALERERGITILAKHTGVFYRGYKLNLVDTPGHSDFGGEVERILNLVDGALLVVDAAEGPLPQTRYVLHKALAAGLVIVVVINKIDRRDARPEAVVDAVLDLFIELGATGEQADFPVLYAAGRAGIASESLQEAQAALAFPGAGSLGPLLDAVVARVPPPRCSEGPLQLLVSNLDYDDYAGRLAIGRVQRGPVRGGQPVLVVRAGREGGRPAKVAQVFTFARLQREAVAQAPPGEIVALSGLDEVAIGDTLTAPERPEALPALTVDEPTVAVTFRVNDGPLAGREGPYVTSRQLRERLERAARVDVALRVEEGEGPDSFRVVGRGELHLGILMETMRREGYEFTVSKPQVVLKEEEGRLSEPMEEVTVDVPQACLGTVVELLGERKAELTDVRPYGGDTVRAAFLAPARGLIGLRSRLLTETKGYGVLYHRFAGYGPHRGPIPDRETGSLVAWEAGRATAYALTHVQERGRLFIKPGSEVYEGMIVGEHARAGDLDVNVVKKRHATNMRSSTAEVAERLDAPRELGLEEALGFIAGDELVEVTPAAIRLRKRILARHRRHSLRKQDVQV